MNIKWKIFDKKYVNSTGVYNAKKYFGNIDKNASKLKEIYKNIKNVSSSIGAKNLILLSQIHSNICKIITDDLYLHDNLENKYLKEDKYKNISSDLISTKLVNINESSQIKDYNIDLYNQYIQNSGDCLITNIPNLAISVLTADCCPVLLYNKNPYIVAAIHCGYKSARADIIKNAINAMKLICSILVSRFNNLETNINRVDNLENIDIRAIIGPTIAKNSYEVGQDFFDAFCTKNNKSQLEENKEYSDILDNSFVDMDNRKFFSKSSKNGHYLFDLPEFVKDKLKKENIQIETHINEDTYSNPEKYPSFRRNCHDGVKRVTSSILSSIMIVK